MCVCQSRSGQDSKISRGNGLSNRFKKSFNNFDCNSNKIQLCLGQVPRIFKVKLGIPHYQSKWIDKV